MSSIGYWVAMLNHGDPPPTPSVDRERRVARLERRLGPSLDPFVKIPKNRAAQQRRRNRKTRCHICMDAACSVDLECGHTMCRRCAYQTFRRKPHCPFCRARVSKTLLRALGATKYKITYQIPGIQCCPACGCPIERVGDDRHIECPCGAEFTWREPMHSDSHLGRLLVVAVVLFFAYIHFAVQRRSYDVARILY